MNISIIIPTHNRINKLKRLLECINNQLKGDYSYNTIIVVDGSSDGTIEYLRTECPWCEIIVGDGNLWYTKSINVGIKYAYRSTPDYYLLLNDDLIIKEDYLLKQSQILGLISEEIILGSIVLTNEIKPRIYFGGVINTDFYFYKNTPYFSILESADDLKGIHPTTQLTGRGMFISNNVISKIGYFDERLLQYGSDTEFCLRAKRKGIDILINWETPVYSDWKLTSEYSLFQNISFSKYYKSIFFNKYSPNFIFNSVYIALKHYSFVTFPIIFIKIFYGKFFKFYKYRTK